MPLKKVRPNNRTSTPPGPLQPSITDFLKVKRNETKSPRNLLPNKNDDTICIVQKKTVLGNRWVRENVIKNPIKTDPLIKKEEITKVSIFLHF